MKNTTVSISDNKTASNAEIKQGLSEIALKDLLGFTLFNTAELAGLFSDIMNTSQTSGPMDFALMRFIALFCGACMYIFLAHFKGRDELVRSRSCIAVACLLQLVLPSFVLLELYANLSISIVVIGFSWMLWGVCTLVSLLRMGRRTKLTRRSSCLQDESVGFLRNSCFCNCRPLASR